MIAASDGQHSEASVASPHPNEFDCARIRRVLSARMRYRYVTPCVYPVHNGYRIESPCCSRNIDKEGGVIDIAWIQYLPDRGIWHLYRKDHLLDRWEFYTILDSLTEAMELLRRDPLRVFWP